MAGVNALVKASLYDRYRMISHSHDLSSMSNIYSPLPIVPRTVNHPHLVHHKFETPLRGKVTISDVVDLRIGGFAGARCRIGMIVRIRNDTCASRWQFLACITIRAPTANLTCNIRVVHEINFACLQDCRHFCIFQLRVRRSDICLDIVSIPR